MSNNFNLVTDVARRCTIANHWKLPHVTLRLLNRHFVSGVLLFHAINTMCSFSGGRIPLYTRVSSFRMAAVSVTERRVDGSSGGTIESTSGRVLPRHFIESWADRQDDCVWTEDGGRRTVRLLCDVSGSGAGKWAAFRGPILSECLPCVQMRLSDIHGRGLFTNEPIPKGTVVFHHERLHFVDAVAATMTIERHAESHKMRGLARYNHRCGGLMPYPVTMLPMHLVNHSCDANIGSASTDPLATSYINAVHLHRTDALTQAANACAYRDANSYIALRDIAAGEELTVNYRRLVAPFFPGEYSLLSPEEHRCRCGSPSCTGEVLAADFLRRKVKFANSIEELLSQGYDDECVIMSLLRQRGHLVRYMHNDFSGIDPRHIERVAQANDFIAGQRAVLRRAADRCYQAIDQGFDNCNAKGAARDESTATSASSSAALPCTPCDPAEINGDHPQYTVSCIMERRRIWKKYLVEQLKALIMNLNDAYPPEVLVKTTTRSDPSGRSNSSS